jgi:hypothetical protein
MTTARILAVLTLTALMIRADGLRAQTADEQVTVPDAERVEEPGDGIVENALAPEFSPASTPGVGSDENIVIPDADLDEEPTIGADHEVPVTLATGPLWVIRPIGGVDIGIAASEQDLVNPVFAVHLGITRWDAREALPPLASLHNDQTLWADIRARVEIGVGGDDDSIPTMEGLFSAIRKLRFLDRDSDGFTTSVATTWGRVHVSRNLRIERGVRVEATAGDYGFGVTFKERPGVAMMLDMHVGLPGYTYVSAQGRADAFHGLQLTRLSFEAGPDTMWVRFVGGGSASAAIGAELGPTATVRSDMMVFTGADAQFHPMAVFSARLHYDAAQDSYRNRIDGAWRVVATLGTRF